jgi:Cu/Zn superoxide dismutase
MVAGSSGRHVDSSHEREDAMKRSGWLAMLLVAPFLAACAQGGDAGGDQMAQDTAQETAATDAEAGDMMEGTSVALAPKNESGVAGTAVLTSAEGDSLDVALSLSGVKDGESYPAHVHEGSCQEPGGVVSGLTEVTADGTTGTSTTRVPDPRAGDAAGPFLVMAHLPDGTPAACGDIPTEMEPPAGGQDTSGESGDGES